MPELPEVETVRQGLMKGMQGKTFDAVSYTHLTLPTICSV